MKNITFFLLFLAFASIALADNYALLVAGSNGWFNYRHQADVHHAYQMLKGKNFKEENIIVMAFNDIANNTRNPFPGQIFNKPTYADPGVDVYKGAKIDYQGADVTPENFVNILTGKKSLMKGVGSGKVLETD